MLVQRREVSWHASNIMNLPFRKRDHLQCPRAAPSSTRLHAGAAPACTTAPAARRFQNPQHAGSASLLAATLRLVMGQLVMNKLLACAPACAAIAVIKDAFSFATSSDTEAVTRSFTSSGSPKTQMTVALSIPKPTGQDIRTDAK